MADSPHHAAEIHALLFAEGGALTYKNLAKSIGASDAELKEALEKLEQKLIGTGIALVRSDTEAALAIAPEARETAAKAMKEEEERDIGEAGLEVLAIVLYEGPSTRAHIDYIRGVNSSSTIRTLLMRGFLERTGNPEDGREYIYRPTVELLAHLGAGKREDLPEYGTIAATLSAFKAQHHGPAEPPERA